MIIDLTHLIAETTSELLMAGDVISSLPEDMLVKLESDVKAATVEFDKSNPDHPSDAFEITLVLKVCAMLRGQL